MSDSKFIDWLEGFTETEEYLNDLFMWRDMAKAAFDAGRIAERKDCWEIAVNSLCHAGIDTTTAKYISGNIKARGLEI